MGCGGSKETATNASSSKQVDKDKNGAPSPNSSHSSKPKSAYATEKKSNISDHKKTSDTGPKKQPSPQQQPAKDDKPTDQPENVGQLKKEPEKVEQPKKEPEKVEQPKKEPEKQPESVKSLVKEVKSDRSPVKEPPPPPAQPKQEPNPAAKPATPLPVKSESPKPVQEEGSNPEEEMDSSQKSPVKERNVHTTEVQNPMEAAQLKFDSALRIVSSATKPDALFACANKDVIKLIMTRALPPNISTFDLMSKLPNLQFVDISRNQMGPQAFRIIMLSLCNNKTVTSLNIADNLTDTDSAESVGKMLSSNTTLSLLNVSGNNLGKDYFSRCVGPAMATNSSLKSLKCESIGSTDMSVLLENLENNTTLEELNINHNEIYASSKVAEPLTRWLSKSVCALKTLECKNCGFKDDDISLIAASVECNSKLETLDISSNQVANHSVLMSLVTSALKSKSLTSFICTDMYLKSDGGSWSPADSMKFGGSSNIRKMQISNCKLKDEHVVNLFGLIPEGGLSNLSDITLSNNSNLTVKSLEALHGACTGPDGCTIERLSWGLNPADSLPDFLTNFPMPRLDYLNLRRAKISAANVGKLADFCGQNGIGTIVLDGLKLSRSDGISKLLAPTTGVSGIVALSLGGCQVEDKDLACLSEAVKNGMEIHMLKLSGNRISDGFIKGFCNALNEKENHPLALIDLSNNRIGLDGANAFKDLLSSGKTKIHSLNMFNNSIPPAGAAGLVSLLGNSSLQSLQLDKQNAGYEEEDMDAIYRAVCDSLGITVQQEGEEYKSGTSDLPANLPAHFTLRLQGLGGMPGKLGKLLDCASISTDFVNTRIPHVHLQHVTEMAALFKGYSSPRCIFSSADWSSIVGVGKGAPSWLMLPDHRDRAMFVSQLPASITVQKMEGILEMEVDAVVDEVVLLTDMVTKTNTGYAWILLSDLPSVQTAVDYTSNGDAVVYGQTFIMSRLNIQVDDDANNQAEAKARKDMEKRLAERKKDSAKHQALINQSYQESQDRHAYRLAHPAYADGRIW